MTYFRLAEVRANAGVSVTASAFTRLKDMAPLSITTQRFDVFLSHAIDDAVEVLGVKRLLEAAGQSVYVDWMEDPQLDRSRVTTGTADLLRRRMKQCKTLIYLHSSAATRSVWMPWELGHFDGRAGQIWIMPLVQSQDAEFKGTEYLGLYPTVERDPMLRPAVRFEGRLRPLVTAR